MFLRNTSQPSHVWASVFGFPSYLWFQIAAFLEARLAPQGAAQRGGVMVQAEGGAGHDGRLRTIRQIRQPHEE